ncbi:MAG: hypothetical protein WC372_10010 [Candidatus Neomarinimicrobiota bacterium]|jgi:hypothetical protein
MEQIPWSKVKLLNAKDIKKMKCFEVTSDGESLGIFMVGAQQGMAVKLKALASLIDAGRRSE